MSSWKCLISWRRYRLSRSNLKRSIVHPIARFPKHNPADRLCVHTGGTRVNMIVYCCISYFRLSLFCISQQAGAGSRIRINPSSLPAVIFISVKRVGKRTRSLFIFFLNDLFAPLSAIYVPQTHYTEGDYIIRQGATGDTFYIISKGQVKFFLCSPPAAQMKWGFQRKRFRLWRTKCQHRFRNCILTVIIDFGAFLHCSLHHYLFFITPLLWICQVKVTEKKPGHEEQIVLSKLSERQWFGEKALWG